MRFWNIGAEGQLLAGGLATAIVMVYLGTALPPILLFPIMIISAVAAGALAGLLPAIFKAKFNTNETLFTLMMNYVVIKLVDYFYDAWKGTKSTLGQINAGTRSGYLPRLFNNNWSFNLIVVLVLALLVFFYLKKTKHGYEIAVVGESVNTAKYAGINVNRVIIRTMILSGALCGVAGFLTVSGQDHSISSSSTGGGYGFTGIIVAWLAKFNTLQMIVISLFIVFLERGTELIASTNTEFDSSASKIVIGIVLFFVIGAEFFINYKVNFRKKNA
jgi:simple sugar transport system permease protein